MTEERTGLLFAALSAVFLAGVVLISKPLLATMTAWGFTAFFFGFGAVWYSIYFLIRRDFGVFVPTRGAIVAGLVVGALDAGYTLATFSALKILDPGIYAFFSHIADLLTVIVGIMILRERFTGIALAGLPIAIAGLVAMTAKADDVVLEGLVLMFVAAAFFATNAIVIKRYTERYTPIHLAYYRAIALALVMGGVSFSDVNLRWPQDEEWLWLALLGLIGPFLNYLFFFRALQRLAIGRVSLVRMCYSVIVVLAAYVIYEQLPTDRQIVGGVALLAGVALVAIHRAEPVGSKPEG
jgi:drug/metabolite transporter (DMT)-like permease